VEVLTGNVAGLCAAQESQAAPSSSGRPSRFAAIEAICRRRASSKVMPSCSIAMWAVWICRPLSMRSGRRLLIVTLSWTTSSDSAFTTAVKADRTPEDTAISARGVVTMADVMLPIRPKPRARIPSMTRRSASGD
jgi:hypothetical protein